GTADGGRRPRLGLGPGLSAPTSRRTFASRLQAGRWPRGVGCVLATDTVPAMITIYLDGSAVLESGAGDWLSHLLDTDHELVLVAPPDHPGTSLMAWAGHLPAMPDPPVMRMQCPGRSTRGSRRSPSPSIRVTLDGPTSGHNRTLPVEALVTGRLHPRSRGRPEPPPPGVPHVWVPSRRIAPERDRR